ncbi:MAG TPA: SDR family oxidoreductase [Candidatus Competibacteraceae bacterium]|nr:SDR family oxidoreductase [Candidatus Competibacteraceae bacterium]
MDLQLTGKTALVTAASEGLGHACARVLAEEGARVAIVGRNPDKLARAAAGTGLIPIAADLADPMDRERLWREAEAQLGQVDILVLSSGHPAAVPFSRAADADWQRGVALLLDPVLDLGRRALPGMRARGYGRLICIGSIFGREPAPGSVVQSTLRAGLNALVKCIASEAAADGVTANVVCPGYFDTPLTHELAARQAAAEGRSAAAVLDEWRGASPADRFGRPEDLGALVALLASPRGAFINGTTLTIDGGTVHIP